MDRRVEFIGAPINIPNVLSGIQTFVESYLGIMVRAFARNGGVIRPSQDYVTGTPPCDLYVTSGDLMIRPGKILFPISPFPVVEISDELVYTDTSTLIDDTENHTFYVYANYVHTEAGIFKKRAVGFVYNDGLPGNYYDQLLDDVEFEVTASTKDLEVNSSVLVGTLYNDVSQEDAENQGWEYYSGLVINQITGCSFTEHGIMAKFADRYLTLNSTIIDLMSNDTTAGIKVLADADDEISLLVVPSGDGFRWESNTQVAGLDPVNDEDFTTKGWVKNYIEDVLFEIPDILNFRMYDITAIGPAVGGVEPEEEGTLSRALPGFTPRRLRLFFKWGYNNIIGDGYEDTNYFDITTSGVSFANDEVKDYYFWIPQLQSSYKIDNNVGNRVYLKETDGSEFTFADDIQITIPDDPVTNAWIHMNAKEYDMAATPVTAGVDPHPIINQQHYSDSPIYLQGYIDLDAGIKYAIKMRGVSGGESGSWYSLPAGTFDKYYPQADEWITDIAYQNPFIVRHPNIPFHSQLEAPMTLEGSLNGFSVTLDTDLWPDAEQYEIVYSTTVSPSFTNSSHPKQVFSDNYTEVVVSSPGTYYVKLRPLIAGLQVCPDTDIVSSSVLAASVGSQYGELISEVDVNLTTYKGTIEWNNTTSLWDITDLETPAVSGITGVHGQEIDGTPVGGVQYPSLDNLIAYIDGVNYRIDQYDGDSIELTTMAFELFTGTPAQEKTMYVSVSEYGRQLNSCVEYIKDFTIKYIEVDVGVLRHYPVTIRVYQSGFAGNGFDNLLLTQGNTTYQAVMDVQIQGANGNRSFVVDAFDDTYSPVDSHNAGGFSGLIKVYGIQSNNQVVHTTE